MSYKPFSKELHEENDLFAKKIVRDFLVSTKLFRLNESLENQKEEYSKWDMKLIYSNKQRNNGRS